MKTYNIHNSDGEFEYILEINSINKDTTEYTLKYSNSSAWETDVQNTIALKIVDTGDGIVLPKNIKIIEYDDAEMLRIVLNMISQHCKKPPQKYKVYDTTEGIEI
jgi:hypothetical protein